MNATLYDPADVTFQPSDREQHEPADTAPAEQQPVTQQPTQRVQIGPLDV